MHFQILLHEFHELPMQQPHRLHDQMSVYKVLDGNMLSKDNLSIAYGVYILHVDAPGIGSKILKFAVIK